MELRGASPSVAQLLLPLGDVRLEEMAGETPKRRHTRHENQTVILTFLRIFLRQGETNAQGAYLAAQAECEVTPSTVASAGVHASRLLARPTVRVALDQMRKAAAREAELSVAEFYAGLRALRDVASGQATVQETFVDAESGTVKFRDVLMPNLAALGKAVELMGKASGALKDRVEQSISAETLTLAERIMEARARG